MKSAVRSNARGRLIATSIALAVIIGCVVAIVFGSMRSADGTAGSSFDQYASGAVPTVNGTSLPIPGGDLAGERSAVASVANSFVLGEWTFDPSMLQGGTMPAFRATLAALITPKFSQTIDQWDALTEKAASEAGYKSTAQVWSTGVAAVSQDKATALVVGSRTNWLPKTKGKTDYQSLGEEPFRLVISLVKIDGKWLVDSQAPAEGAPQTTANSAPTSGASK